MCVERNIVIYPVSLRCSGKEHCSSSLKFRKKRRKTKNNTRAEWKHDLNPSIEHTCIRSIGKTQFLHTHIYLQRADSTCSTVYVSPCSSSFFRTKFRWYHQKIYVYFFCLSAGHSKQYRLHTAASVMHLLG